MAAVKRLLYLLLAGAMSVPSIQQNTTTTPLIVTKPTTLSWRTLQAKDFLPASLPSMSKNVTITGCILMERGNTNDLHDYAKSAAAIEMAVEWINQNVFPPKLTLQTFYVDIGSRCNEIPTVVAYAMDLWDRNVTCNVYFGPGCGTAAEALNDLAEYLTIPVFVLPAASVGIKAPFADYKLMIRASISHTSMANALLRFLIYFNYTTPYFICDTSTSFFKDMSILMSSTIASKNPGLFYGGKSIQFDSSRTNVSAYGGMLRAVTSVSRVLVIMANATTLRRFMLAAFDEGMTNGEYVFLTIEYFESEFWGKFTWKYNDARDQDAMQAFRTLLILSVRAPLDNNLFNFWRNVKRRSRSENFYNYSHDATPDLIVAYAYDTVYVYASLVVTLLSQGQDFLNGTLLVNEAHNFTFFSVPLNRISKLDASGDRIASYSFRNMDPRTGLYNDLYVLPSTSSIVVTLGTLFWPNGDKLPPNAPYCGFDGKAERCQVLSISLVPALGGSLSAIAVVVIFIPVGVFIYLRKRLAAKRDPYWWRIFQRELLVNPPSTSKFEELGRSVLNGDVPMAHERSVRFSEPENNVSTTQELNILDAVAESYFSVSVLYHSVPIGLTDLPDPKHKASPRIVKNIAPLQSLHHVNLHNFIGVVLSDDNFCLYIAGELCQRRTLTSLLSLDSFPLDQACKNSLMMDIVDGMNALHGSELHSHGNLTSATCLITNQLVLKITDYAVPMLSRAAHWTDPPSSSQSDREFYNLLWRAPELLRFRMSLRGTQKGDVYSFAILLQQIILRSGPFRLEDSHVNKDKAREVVLEVQHGAVPPLRPPVPMSACSHKVYSLMETCWEENPDERPTFSRIRTMVNRAIGQADRNLLGSLIKSMEKYAITLESQVEDQMRNFMEEKRRSEQMLGFLLPQPIADAIQRHKTVYPEMFDSATVCFADAPQFSKLLVSGCPLKRIVEVLNTLCGIFDTATRKFDVYDVETLNDSHLLVSGIPVRNGMDHAKQIVCMAMSLLQDTEKFGSDGIASRPSEEHFDLRFGVNSGPCVTGVIGLKLPRYCLFGDTVNTAARMKTYGEAGKIHGSSWTKDLLDQTCNGEFLLTSRGRIEIKGKGSMETYWILGNH